MNYVTKFMNIYQVNFDGIVGKVNGLPSHNYIAKMARIFNVPLDRVRVKFLGCFCLPVPMFPVPMYENVGLPF